MAIRQELSAEKAALFNQYGRGFIHMGLFNAATVVVLVEEAGRLMKVLVEEKDLKNLISRIKLLEDQIKQMPVVLESRLFEGVKSGATLAIAAGGNVYQPIDGLDVTLDHDSDQVMVDFAVECSFSASPGTISLAVEVDGGLDLRNMVSFQPAATSRAAYSGSVAPSPGRGRHRYRLMMTSTNANTATFTARNRHMRVTGLINKRRKRRHGN